MAEAERAWGKLQTIEIKDKEIDLYISEFENLLMLAGRERNDAGSIDYFHSGLKVWLHKTLLQRQPIPRTLDQWQTMAREEVEIKTLMGVAMGTKPKGWLVSQDSRFQSVQSSQPQQQKRRDPDTMDIDAMRTQMTNEEQNSLMKAGKCFNCKQTGHLSCTCPKKGKGKGKARNNKPREGKARTAQVEEVDEGTLKEAPSTSKGEESPPQYSKGDLTAAVAQLSTEDRENLLESLSLGDF